MPDEPDGDEGHDRLDMVGFVQPDISAAVELPLKRGNPSHGALDPSVRPEPVEGSP